MEFVAFGMAAVGFVELILRTWDTIENKKRNSKEAKLFATELKLFGLSDRREGFKLDLELSQKIMRDRSTPQTTKDSVASAFKRLSDQLEAIPSQLDLVIEYRQESWKHLRKKSGAVKELNAKVAKFSEASANFHQRVMGFREITTSESDLLLTDQDLKFIGAVPEITKLAADGTLYIARISHAVPGKSLEAKDALFESKPDSERFTDQESRSLASKLHAALPSWNIPRLIGYRGNHDLIFDRPDPSKNIKTLSQVYADKMVEPSLNIRLRLCNQLATAVLQTHTLGLVHKNIRPENILITWTSADANVVTQASLFLSGWQHARGLDGEATKMIGESIAQKAIYQHPQRQTRDGKPAAHQYSIGHDIYSLGVCILELLTWKPIISRDQEGGKLSDAYRETFKDLGFDANVLEEHEGFSEAELLTADSKEVQKTLVTMSKKLIGQRAGDRLAELAVKCLECLDLEPSFGEYVTGCADKNTVTESFVNDVFDVFDKILSVL